MLYTDQGTFCTQLIFWEMGTPAQRKKYPPLYTMKQEEHKGLPSAYAIYMSCVDEYEAAIKLVGNLKNWAKLCESSWFMDGFSVHGHQGLATWREHMKLRDSSLAKSLLIEQTKEGNTTAARALLAESKVKKPAGRKSKKVPVESSTVSRINDFKKKQGK